MAQVSSVRPTLPGRLGQPQKNMYFGQNGSLFKLVTLRVRAQPAPSQLCILSSSLVTTKNRCPNPEPSIPPAWGGDQPRQGSQSWPWPCRLWKLWSVKAGRTGQGGGHRGMCQQVQGVPLQVFRAPQRQGGGPESWWDLGPGPLNRSAARVYPSWATGGCQQLPPPREATCSKWQGRTHRCETLPCPGPGVPKMADAASATGASAPSCARRSCLFCGAHSLSLPGF